HLSDFFIDFGANRDKAQHDIWRTLDLMFGKPYVTPTFDEFAMFMAFSSSLRSADLSRQVGAVMTKNKNIIATGANDIPQFGGGLYWPEYDSSGVKIIDKDNGRDWKRGFDSNAREKKLIINNIIDSLPDEKAKDTLRELLHSSKIKDITEYGRVVHAEMEAILACARSDISTKDAELYCTTFPCHNCAKHIVASGIKRVVYVEPYPKSKALDFHSDSITLELDGEEGVKFEPFVGVGPRSFYDLFSTNLGAGYPIKRKDPSGNTVSWNENSAILRMQMLSTSYIERETAAASAISDYRSKYNDSK
ncbi:deoxycytidylate deaminase, partial [Vibrio anguillarum]